MEQDLFQKDSARLIGIKAETYFTWETDQTKPELRYWPGILAFLGYDPHPPPATLGEKLQARYRQLGLPRKKVALLLGLDEGTLGRYERGEWDPTKPCSREIIAWFIRTDGASATRRHLDGEMG